MSAYVQSLLSVLVTSIPLVLSGCALQTGHTIDPYGSDVTKACELERRAADVCRAHLGGRLPPYSFTTDGCSYWLDGNWQDCCVEHDIAYWCGGTHADRVEADRKLQECVKKATGSCCLGGSMRLGVTLFGTSVLPTSFRWGYGWPYPLSGP